MACNYCDGSEKTKTPDELANVYVIVHPYAAAPNSPTLLIAIMPPINFGKNRAIRAMILAVAALGVIPCLIHSTTKAHGENLSIMSPSPFIF